MEDHVEHQSEMSQKEMSKDKGDGDKVEVKVESRPQNKEKNKMVAPVIDMVKCA